jgi:hypothetical protein
MNNLKQTSATAGPLGTLSTFAALLLLPDSHISLCWHQHGTGASKHSGMRLQWHKVTVASGLHRNTGIQ